MAWYDNLNLKINQNLLALIIGYAALGLSDFYKLEFLYYLSGFYSLIMTVYVLIAFFFYTFKYVQHKKE